MLVYAETFAGEKAIAHIHHDDEYQPRGLLGDVDPSLAYVIDEIEIVDGLSWRDEPVASIRCRKTVAVAGQYRCVEITDAEADAIRRAAGIEVIDIERSELLEVIAAAERQADMPDTHEEAVRRMRAYNNTNNEGGGGYVPYIYSREEYDAAVRRLSKL